MAQLEDAPLSKGVMLKVRVLPRVPELCECATERLGDGLQIRFMQVRFLSLTPFANKSSVVIVQQSIKKVVDKKFGLSYTLFID